MHPSISIFPNTSFYGGKLLDAPSVMQKEHQKKYLPGSMFGTYSFFNIEDSWEDVDELGHSRKNVVEVTVIQEILQSLRRGMSSVIILFYYVWTVKFIYFFYLTLLQEYWIYFWTIYL